MKRSLRPGEMLFGEGDPAGSAYLIEGGTLEVFTGSGADEVVLSRLVQGDILGEMAVIDSAPRSASARAIDEVVLTEIDKTQFAERIDRSDPVVRSLLQVLLRRYRGALSTMRGHAVDMPLPVGLGQDFAVGKIRLETQLREALSTDGLDIRLQPLLDIPGGLIGGFEALVRWQHPERGQVSPAEFIALAEETSLIVPVGEYVLDRACGVLSQVHSAQPEHPPFVAINLSARQLAEPGLIEGVLSRIHAQGLPSSAVKLEITESLSLDYGRVSEVVAECHRHGIPVAMDDFGTGYSNFEHLQRLQFDTVKIDQAFARGMEQSGRGMAILRNMVAMIHDLGAEVVVEGIEYPSQLEALRELGVKYAQGYLIGKPQTIDEAVGLLTRSEG